MFLRHFRSNLKLYQNYRDLRIFSTEASSSEIQRTEDKVLDGNPSTPKLNQTVIPETRDSGKPFSELAEYRFIYPEFLPNARYQWRHKLREKLERVDMLRRRTVIDIPEFYVGSILAVIAADPNSPDKENRFVGICILRIHDGMRACFTLRNVVDQQGVEIVYDLYNPTIKKIEVLRLEKRLDNEMLYLRDSLPEYSMFPFDMEPEYQVKGEPVKINNLKVILKPPPWTLRWELYNLKGVEPFEVPEWKAKRAKKIETPWEAYDLMKQYRRCITEEDQQEIWEDVDAHQQNFQTGKRKWKGRNLQKAARKT